MKHQTLTIFHSISFVLITLLTSCGGATPATTSNNATEIIEPENLSKLQILDKWGKGNVYGVALSPDETGIAVSTATGIYIYDYDTLQGKQFIDLPISTKGGHSPSKSISFSPEGDLLALGYDDITIWDLTGNKVDRRISNRIANYEIVQIAYSPKGNTIAVVSMGSYFPCDASGGNFALYSVESGNLLYSDFFCPEAALFHFSFLSDGNIAFVGIPANSSNRSYKASIVDGNTGALVKEFSSNEYIDSMSMDGSKVSVRTADNTEIIDINTQKPIDNMEGIVIFLPENQHELIETEKGWTIIESNHKAVCDFESSPNLGLDVYRSAFTLIGDKLIFWDYWYQNVEIWDLKRCEPIKQLHLPTARDSLGYSNDGSLLATHSLSDIHILNGENGDYKFSISGDYRISPQQYYDFSKDSNVIAVVREISLDNPYAITFWDTETGKQLQSIQTEFVYFNHISWIAGSALVATEDKNGLHFWDVKSHSLLYTIPERPPDLYFNSEKDYFALRERDGDGIVFRNINNGNIRNKIFISKEHFNVVFSRDWAFIAIAKSENIELWDINGNKLREFMEDTPTASTSESRVTYDIKFSPDNRLLAAIRYDYENYSIRFWDTRTGNILRDIMVPFEISMMEFSPDGKKLTVLGNGIIYVFGINASQ